MPKDAVIKQMKNSRVTAISMINLRALAGLQNINEMLKQNAQTPWGNRFGFLLVPIPIMGTLKNPLEFMRRIKGNMDKHKISLGMFITARLLRYLASLKVPRAVSRPSYNVITNTTMMISNMIGPVEKIVMGGNTVKSFSFFVSGVPQALQVCIVSYMDVVVLQVYAHKAYVDANIMSDCFMEGFEEMKKMAL
uniref:O-acyltransferase WSD1 C-terminal domain-containing protein n=1 Tax=Picea sitchensis TaxID=3332 RepID=B8LLI6_PICSI|nr:unknown [Picea sitchensis]